jgi:hypothetical protein
MTFVMSVGLSVHGKVVHETEKLSENRIKLLTH